MVQLRINYVIFCSENQAFNWTYGLTDLDSVNCSIEEPLSFIIPGWKEDCNATEWIIDMVDSKKLVKI